MTTWCFSKRTDRASTAASRTTCSCGTSCKKECTYDWQYALLAACYRVFRTETRCTNYKYTPFSANFQRHFYHRLVTYQSQILALSLRDQPRYLRYEFSKNLVLYFAIHSPRHIIQRARMSASTSRCL